MDVFRTRSYERKAKKLLDEQEIYDAEEGVILTPEKWPVIAGTGGVRKARAARGNSGKSGGVRIIYYYLLRNREIFLLDIYAKSQRENISEADKKSLRQMVHYLEGGRYETIH